MRITSGYRGWMQQSRRTSSKELAFGAYWRMEGAHWRVSWIEETGELYAADARSDRFLILGHFADRRDVNHKMQHWFQGGDLPGLIQSLKAYS